MESSQQLLFSERQYFRQWWLMAILFGISGLFLVGLFFQLLLGIPFGSKPMPTPALIFVTIFTSGLNSLFLFISLHTNITAEGIAVRFSPFQRMNKIFRTDDIESAEIRTYKPIREYGGWGMRGFGGNRALNIQGNIGIQLVLKNGNKMLIGTSRPHAAHAALRQIGFGKTGIPQDLQYPQKT